MNNLIFLIISFTAITFLSCSSDDHTSSSDDHTTTNVSHAYYSCNDHIVVEITRDGSSMHATVFKGKELLIGRDLKRDSLSDGDLFLTHDMSIKILDNTIEVDAGKIKVTGCNESPGEMERRGKRDVYYYISDAGALITTKPIGRDQIQLELKVGQNVIIDTILPQVRSASGTKYQRGDILFWVKQNTAMLIYEGVLYGHCVVMFEDELSYSSCTDTALHTGVVNFLREELIDDIAFVPENDRQYYAERTDINNDGAEEIFVALARPYFCGTGGCNWYILNPDFTLLQSFSVSDFPVYLSNTTNNEYRELYVKSDGNYHTLKFNNGYPENPALEPTFELFSHPEYTTGGTKRVLEWSYLKGCRF